MTKTAPIWCSVGALCLAAAGSAQAQLRVANWNITSYSSGRVAEFRSAFFDTAPNGLRFVPDIIIVQEMAGSTGVANFLALLNGYTDPSGNPGPRDYAAAPYFDNSVAPSSNPSNAMFYRTSKVSLVGSPVILSSGTGTCATCPPRDNARYLVQLAGYATPATAGTGPQIYLYSAHMKAGDTTADQARRTPESVRLRDNTATLPAGAQFILGGDFNTQSSSQTAWQNLTAGAVLGRFYDPINTPGSWNNNCAFKWVFTQDPAGGTSQLDDRMDFLLISDALKNGGGLDYIGDTTQNYNNWCAANNNWNNPFHSYRVWGNDGSACNTNLTTTGNAMVGTTIATNIAASALNGGHLPVFLDLRVPPRVTAPGTINLGSVQAGSTTTYPITIVNNTDVRTFARDPINAATAGLESLQYTFSGLPAGVSITGGNGAYTLAPLNQPALPAAQVFNSRTHTINFTAPSTPGSYSQVITLSSNSDRPTQTIILVGTITPASAACSVADIAPPGAPDGVVDGSDFVAFINSFAIGDVAVDDAADLNNDGTIDGSDFVAFINAFALGC